MTDAAVREEFTDPVTGTPVVLVIPPGGRSLPVLQPVVREPSASHDQQAPRLHRVKRWLTWGDCTACDGLGCDQCTAGVVTGG